MKISFACPACGATGSADEAFVGRQVRCKPCQHRFVIPSPSDAADDAGYLLDQPTTRGGAGSTSGGAVFVPSRGDEPSVFVSPKKPRSVTTSKSRKPGPEIAWGTWVIRIGIVASVVVAAIAFFAPRGGEIAGSVLVFLGTAMFLVGFAAGAFGAFSEDFLYGFLYIVLPIYTAYYLVTRWEDLWKWCICSTTGVGLVTLGTQMLQWAGVAQ